jgi:zinc transport system substrate-binding protein
MPNMSYVSASCGGKTLAALANRSYNAARITKYSLTGGGTVNLSRWWISAFVAAAGAAVTVGMAGCSKEKQIWDGPHPHVLVSFPPLYSFAKSVAGDEGQVLCLMTLKGPHEYEFQSRDALKLRDADVFFINGLGLDEVLADKLKRNAGKLGMTPIELAEDLPDPIEMQKVKTGDEHAGHAHGSHDPHVWLGIPEAIAMVDKIRKELIKADEKHKESYNKRADAYIKELKELEAYGKEKLAGKEINIVAMHESLNYFARTFGLKIVDMIQANPGDDPPPNKVRDLVKLCKDKRVRIIATEPQYPSRIAEEVVKELKGKDIKIVEVDPLETAKADELDADWYVRKMRKNIDDLAEALKK